MLTVRCILSINTTAFLAVLANEADWIMAASTLSASVGTVISTMALALPLVHNVAAISSD